MNILDCIFVSVFLIVTNGFSVHGPSTPLVAPLGSSVVLPCYVDDGLLMEDLEVEWRRADSEALVHLYQYGESRPEAQQQDYHDRAHLFSEEIQHGNFSLRLGDLRAEDKGEYRCTVYIQHDSGETVVQIKDVERLLVSGSSRSVSAYVDEDVTLNCSVDSHITPEHIEELSWKKTDKDGDILALLYQDNKIFPEATHEQYRERVEFFTCEIPKGNFSLRLKSVRTEDKGVYICQVFAGDLSANATVQLEQLGFSFLHIAVLVFCFAAGSGALFLLCSLIYCRSKNTVTISTIWNLQFSLVLFPNICMFFAFFVWGFTEGSLHETVICCALYILRPIMLICSLPRLKYLQGNLKPWIEIFTTTSEFAFFTVVVYAVLLSRGWRLRAHDTTIGYRGGTASESRSSSALFFGILVLISLILSTVDIFRLCCQEKPRGLIQSQDFAFKQFRLFCSFTSALSCVQLLQLATSFGLASQGFFFLGAFFIPFVLHLPAVLKCLRQQWVLLLWILTISLLDIIIVIYGHLVMLEKEKDCMEWICVILLLEILKIISIYTFEYLCHEVMYMFGAVGLVLLSSVTLMAELILKARNGERVIKDLRVVVFPSECAFALYWLVLQIHAYRKVFKRVTHSQRNTPQRHQLGSTEENHEMEILSTADSAVSQ